MRTILIGNQDNRRVSLYCEALAEAGHPSAELLSYQELLENPERLADLSPAEAVVRQDSAGENFEVEKALLIRGYPMARELGVSVIDPDEVRALSFDRGRIICPRQLHLGFVSLLDALEQLYAERPRWRVLQPPSGIKTLFDKRQTSALWQQAGVAVPNTIAGVTSYDSLREIAAEHREIYIKVSCSSSASCLAIYSRRGDAEQLITTIECAETGWYNSLRLSRYRERPRIAEVVDFLLAEGSQVEAGLPKARIAGHPFDIRFVVAGGEAGFGLVRQNRHAITNLHLGGWRTEWSELEKTIDPDIIESARSDAVKAASVSGCFVVGVDVLIESNRRKHRVIEGNAFGDLLPGLTRDGLSVYGWQIKHSHAAS